MKKLPKRSLPKNTFKYNTKVWNVFEFLRQNGTITADRIINEFREFQYNRCIKNIRDKLDGTGWRVENVKDGVFELKEVETAQGQTLFAWQINRRDII